jgi:hypothetical protein
MVDMECFAYGNSLICGSNVMASNSVAGNSVLAYMIVDGVISYESELYYISSSAFWNSTNSFNGIHKNVYLGLHKSDVRWQVAGGTGTAYGTARNMSIEGRA